jgi:hypothetical protein
LGWGWGWSGQRPVDGFHHRLSIAKHVVVPEPQNPKPGVLEKPGASGVSVFSVLPAVDFHRQLCFEADKVEDVVSERVLPSKFETADLPSLK